MPIFYDVELKARLFFYKEKIKSRKFNIIKSFDFFSKRGVLFIHIPKTAGLSVYQALFEVDSLGHVPIIDYQGLYGKKRINSMFKFCFVRNPYDRLYSAYSYLKKGGRGEPSDLDYQDRLKNVKNFEDFVFNYLHEKNIKSMVHFNTQTFYLLDKKGNLNIDYIGKFETLEKDFKIICRKLGKVESKLPLVNINTLKKDHNFSKELKDVIFKYYKEDFINFGYQK